jgi:putative FmdB family regulatory protein
MPTYEYRCPEGHRFELFQRMSEPPEAVCPTCGAAAERMLSSGAGLLFKGSGFYITDYARGDSYRKAAEADSGTAPKEPASKPASDAPATPPAKATRPPAGDGGGGNKD